MHSLNFVYPYKKEHMYVFFKKKVFFFSLRLLLLCFFFYLIMFIQTDKVLLRVTCQPSETVSSGPFVATCPRSFFCRSSCGFCWNLQRKFIQRYTRKRKFSSYPPTSNGFLVYAKTIMIGSPVKQM
ncbi:hypothetical protein BDF21DRAFT_411139 [Thamnidium elegans]|nr:hypothetical protein BDF21DRAFT_411139 [Thamnidium elegans]